MTEEERQQHAAMVIAKNSFFGDLLEEKKPAIPPYDRDKVLESNELMAGEWVVASTIRDGVEYNVELLKVKGYEINDIEFEEKHKLSKRKYYAILISEEILKKSGFKLFENVWYKPGVPFTLTKKKDVWAVNQWTIKIKYVHELQTALWLSKVDNEIIF